MYSDADIEEFYEYALKLTKQAGQLIRERIWKTKTIEEKSCEVDLVTETDKEVESLLINGLSEKFPDHKFIGEESVAAGEKCVLTDSPTWIIDPVDGTMNFVHGFPHCCVSIGLYISSTPKIGIIYNPTLEQLFTAKAGHGAFLNGNRIHVSQEKSLNKALLGFEIGTNKDPEKMELVKKNFLKLAFSVHGTRSLGSAALNMAMVAMGATDANFEFGIHAWDVAAGGLIVQEAGGIVMDPAGGEFDIMSRRVLCTSTIELANEICKQIEQYYPERD